jgi:hypothetical protein
MTDVILQALVGLGFLGLGVWWCYRRWIAPRAASVSLNGRGLLLLVSVTLMGGFIGSPFWWYGEPRAFAWRLPPLAGRMLASAGWSFAVVSFLALERPARRSLRLALLLLATYLAPLAAAILIFHRNRFDPAAAITYVFFLIVGSMVAVTGWYWFRFPVDWKDETAQPARATVRGWLFISAGVMAAWGLALFASDTGSLPLVWAWPGDLLTSRLIGVMLLTIAAGSAYAAQDRATAQPMLAMTLTYGLGVCAASLWNALAGKPVPLGYAVGFAGLALGSAAFLFAARARPTG